MAEDEGFEPPQTESESGVLPLHKSSKRNSVIICKNFEKSRSFLLFGKLLFLSCLLPRERLSFQDILPQIAEGHILPLIPQHGQNICQFPHRLGMHQ